MYLIVTPIFKNQERKIMFAFREQELKTRKQKAKEELIFDNYVCFGIHLAKERRDFLNYSQIRSVSPYPSMLSHQDYVLSDIKSIAMNVEFKIQFCIRQHSIEIYRF